MSVNLLHKIPYGNYPLDITSPGPDQRPGVAQAQRVIYNPPEVVRCPVLPIKEDKPNNPSEEQK